MTVDIRTTLDRLLATRILVLDGAMGTMIQRHKLTEAEFRGGGSRRIRAICKGNNDCSC